MELAGESRKNVRSRAKELKEELYSIRTVFFVVESTGEEFEKYK